MRKVSIAMAAAILVVTGIVQGQSKTDPMLNKMATEWAAAYNAKDAAKLAGFYTEDAVFMPPNQPMAKGRAAIEAQFKREFQQGFTNLKLTDETYWAFHGDEKRINVLANSIEEGQARTQLWAYEHLQGRVFGCIPGHYTWTFDDPLYRVLVLRGIAWAAREKDVNRLLELAPVGARMAP